MALNVEIGRRVALFCSDLSAAERPGRAELDAAIGRAVRSHGGTAGCAADMAQEFGDHPDMALERMRWAREVVAKVYERPATHRHPSRAAS